MKALLFVFSLAIVGCTSLPWKPLKTFQETFWEAKLAAENVIGSVDEILQNRTKDSHDFINFMENSKIAMERLNRDRGNYECSSKFADLKNDFRNVYNRLEVPLMRQVADIRQKLSDVVSNMVYYLSIADSKYWGCQLSRTEDCIDDVEKWLDTKMTLLSCEMVPCESHLVKKRQSDWFGFGDDACPGSFQCPNSICVDNSKICDGYDDCGDSSDEVDCPQLHSTLTTARSVIINSPSNCSSERGTYLCGNNECIPLSKVCDGNYDCGDKSDEHNCLKEVHYSPSNCSLEIGTYLCDNRKCVNLSSVCDGNDDCGDGSDEGGNCTSRCREDCHPRGVCLNTPKSKECITFCPRGFFETASACLRTIEPDRSPVSNQLLDLEKSISRHSAAYSLLKTRTISEMFMLSFSTDCSKYKISMLDKITKIQDRSFNQLSGDSKISTVSP